MKKYTYDEINNIVKSHGYVLLSNEYLDNKSKIVAKDRDGYLYEISLHNFLRGFMPSKFHTKNPYTIYNINLYLQLNNINVKLLTEIYTDRMKLKFQCLKEDRKEIYYMTLAKLQNGQRCPYCCGHKVGISNCLATLRPDIAKEWHKIKNGELTPYNVTLHSTSKKIWWQCQNNKTHIWQSNVDKRVQGRMCPFCYQSMGAKKIYNYLINNNIDFKCEYSFEDLVGLGGGLLKFDFAIFQNNKLYKLCEFDGRQHEMFVDYLHQTKENFEKLKIHDRMKNEYVKRNQIPFKRINWRDFDNIEQILKQELALEN